ncbi:MAG: methylated-DNA--[protein]-cysteine S-methyltransferase, partial [Coriobacteriia bacterium]|nr:methylated-DNA--[protein]-cysteine S-methyltransferase [Coriobacteriia bacterium]
MGREERIFYDVVPTALGEALVAATAEGVRAVYLGEDGADLERQVRERFPEAEVERDPGAVREWAAEVARRAEGLPPTAEVPLDLAGTPFQVAVWRALLDIPAGETRTYGDVARGIGRPSAQRAVGSACARNEISVLVPCHRVVPA